MARDRSPIVKQSRREGVALHPKAHKVMARRTAGPGQDPNIRRRGRLSDYGVQLREKQKVKRMYGLLEKQFRKLLKESSRQAGKTGENLLRLLEQRLDNTVYRAGFAPSRRAARQLVSHGHFEVNGRRTNVPSFRVTPGDEVKLRAKSLKNEYFTQFDDFNPDVEAHPVSWVSPNKKDFSLKVTGLPQREDSDETIKEQLIVEYYSR